MKWFLLLIVFIPFLSNAALPKDAQNYLEQIPEKKLTLPYVVKVALLHADAYRMIGLDYISADLEELGQIDPLTDTYLTGGWSYSDDNSTKTNPFQPLRAQSTQWNLGLQKGWSTGTTTSVQWQHDINDLEFGNLGPFGNSFITDYKQSVAVLNLEQNLLKDSFGYAFRKKREAARLRGDAIEWSARDSFESTTLQFIGEFYNAWLLQQQVSSLKDQVAREKRLVRILTNRSKKGAVEAPDLIQVEALLASNQTRLSQAKTQLAQQWEQLVIGLKLPKSFLGIDPMDVPTSIDDPVSAGLRVCGKEEPTKTARIHSLEKRLESLESDYQASKNESLPDLKLVAGYRGNAIDSRAAQTVEDVFDGRDDVGFGLGPAWNVGVKLNIPLSNSAARAQRAQKYVQKEQTVVQLGLAVDELKTLWRSTCRKLEAERKNEKLYNRVVKEQKRRVQAEEKRFRLGRVGVNQLVTAEDDLGLWEFQSQQKSIEVRQLAWQVQRYSGELFKQLSPHIQSRLKEASFE